MTDKLSEVLVERKSQHGDFDDHARISQDLKAIMRREIGWQRLTKTQQEGLEMIQHKIARILAGDPSHLDHWLDIEGYTRITRERIKK